MEFSRWQYKDLLRTRIKGVARAIETLDIPDEIFNKALDAFENGETIVLKARIIEPNDGKASYGLIKLDLDVDPEYDWGEIPSVEDVASGKATNKEEN